jgi:hypothetical protein
MQIHITMITVVSINLVAGGGLRRNNKFIRATSVTAAFGNRCLCTTSVFNLKVLFFFFFFFFFFLLSSSLTRRYSEDVGPLNLTWNIPAAGM